VNPNDLTSSGSENLFGDGVGCSVSPGIWTGNQRRDLAEFSVAYQSPRLRTREQYSYSTQTGNPVLSRGLIGAGTAGSVFSSFRHFFPSELEWISEVRTDSAAIPAVGIIH
jgi:hypothetical protein